MHRPLPLTITAVLAGALLGCDSPARVTAPSQALPGSLGASANFASATVSRFTDFVGDFLIDEDQELSALIGRTYETVVSVCTGGPDAPDTGLVQVVQHPDGSANVRIRAGEVNVVVWTTVLPPDDCSLFLSTAPSATGTVRVSLGIREPADHGAFKFGVRYVGSVTSEETGQRYHFLFTGHILVTPSGQVHTSGGGIKLTPIG